MLVGTAGGSAHHDRMRRRIVDAAAAELAHGGGAELSLRSVARSVGVTVQSLYHYFDGRAALVDELADTAAGALAARIESALAAAGGAARQDRLLRAGVAYRDWAAANRSAFALLHGRCLPLGLRAADGGAGRLRDAMLSALPELPAEVPSLPAVQFWATVHAGVVAEHAARAHAPDVAVLLAAAARSAAACSPSGG